MSSRWTAAFAQFLERKSRVGEVRFFGGFTVEETAAVLGVGAHHDVVGFGSWPSLTGAGPST